MNITSFRGYEILEVLPSGGMSTVYKARQLSLDRIVAIKALPSTMGGASPADLEKFMAEARITASLKHPNIVQVYDFGKSEDGICYFAMEYISGYSIAAWIRRKQYLSEENSLLCAMSVAEAMNYAWQKAGIVHCDIKPDNVIIDDDGTVKLADLGLARSVQSISGQVKPADRLIFGTPNYISPEQSRGDEPLDCRADIYSLGAMLYHCLTGTMPFEGMPPSEVMDRQIADFIPDPQDVNPRISVWSACLIEKMMAKDRNFRPQDWNETLRDISNARSEMMPQGSLPPGVLSTLKRSALRDLRLQEICHPPPPALTEKQLSLDLLRKIGLSAGGALLILAAGWSAFYFAGKHKIRSGQDSAPIQEAKEIEDSDLRADAERRAFEKYEEVIAWVKANPALVDEAIARFQKLAGEVADTKYAGMASDEARNLARGMSEIRETIAELDREANRLAAQNSFPEAAAVYEKYQGPFEKETADERQQKAAFFQSKHADYLEEQSWIAEKAELQLRQLADEIAKILVEEDVNAACKRLGELASELPLISVKPEFKDLMATLQKSALAEQRIIDSFRPQKDREINISFLHGPQKLLVRAVQGELVIAEKVMATEHGTIAMQKTFKARDLAHSEKIDRIGDGKEPELALMRSMLFLQHGNYPQAAAAASGTGAFLSDSLVAAIGQRAKDVSEEGAARALTSILRRTGIQDKDSMPDPESCLDILREKTPPFQKRAALSRMISQFLSKFGSTEIAKRYAEVLEALAGADQEGREKIARASPPFRPSEQVQSARPLIKSVTAKMMEQNTGLQEEEIVFQADDSGRIIKAEIVSMHLRDIKALENLTDLQKLVCAGMRQDAWPEIPSVAPLFDISPLRKIPLRELSVNHTRIKDISALSQIPLTRLNLAHTRVNYLQALKEMPLQHLDLSFTPVSDIRPLAGLPLAYLNISGTEVSNLSPLSGMALKTLSAASTKTRDLSPLRSMPLKNLALGNTEVSDITPLKEMPLEYLDLADTNVRDILPLRGMRLRKLDLRNTRVKDLNALSEMPLEQLNISGSAVRDISALKTMPLKALDLRNTNITDLTPLLATPIEEIWLDDFYDQADREKTRTILAVLHKMPQLKSINGRFLWGRMRRD